MTRPKKPFVILIIVLSFSFSALTSTQTQAETEYTVALQGPTWDHSAIRILVDTPSNESWWNPSYLTATLHAIAQWNEAIGYFASNHSDFAYLSQLKIIPHFSSSADRDIDAYVSWIEQFGNDTCEAGLTRTTYTSLGTVTNSSLTISAYDCRGNVLSEADSQNVVLHELGHVLGLAHANYSDDLMYFSYTLNSPVRAISTLDLYGVGIVFRWMAVSSEFDKANFGSQIYSVTLPPDIIYEYLPISEENLPPPSQLDRIRAFFGYIPVDFSDPGFYALMGLFTVAAIAGYLILRRAWRKRAISEKLGSNLKNHDHA
jgi:hypothetical protein